MRGNRFPAHLRGDRSRNGLDDRLCSAQSDAETIQCPKECVEKIAADKCMSGGDLRISRYEINE
nr:MAG TPA: hypothetical protein [Bacteriophage sp.]